MRGNKSIKKGERVQIEMKGRWKEKENGQREEIADGFGERRGERGKRQRRVEKKKR